MVIGSSGKYWPFEPIGANGSRFRCIESVMSVHKLLFYNCSFCDFKADSQDEFETHLVDCHPEFVMLRTMANQVNNFH